MHFTGMMAFRLPIPVQYDWPTVLYSLLVGILGSAAALFVVGSDKIGWPRALAASIFLGGVGISCLHFTSMDAMRMQAMHDYSPRSRPFRSCWRSCSLSCHTLSAFFGSTVASAAACEATGAHC